MIMTCCICNKIIQDGQRVRVMVEATYHILKSTIAYALSKDDMEADQTTLCHKECHLLEASK